MDHEKYAACIKESADINKKSELIDNLK